MTESNTTFMLQIMENQLHLPAEDTDSRYHGMLDMFNQLICIKDEETCKEVIAYFIDNNEISGKERTEFAKTVVSFDYFIENYERAIDDGYITSNVNATLMLDVFKVFRHSNVMNIIFYEKFGTRAEYWNARLNNVSKLNDCKGMLDESTINKINTLDKHTFKFGIGFADKSNLQLITSRDTILSHSVIED